MNSNPAGPDRPHPAEPAGLADETPLGLSLEEHQGFLLAIEAGQRELRLAAQVPNGPHAVAEIHRHLQRAAEWLAEAKRLVEQR